MLAILRPHRYIDKVSSLKIAELMARGIRCVMLDRDNTCVPYNAQAAPADVKSWFSRAQAAGLSLYIVSNNRNVTAVKRSGYELNVDAVGKAMKPSPRVIKHIMKRDGFASSEVLFVGDQIFTDVLAAHFSGVISVLVVPQCTQDMWHARILRGIERRILGDMPLERS